MGVTGKNKRPTMAGIKGWQQAGLSLPSTLTDIGQEAGCTHALAGRAANQGHRATPNVFACEANEARGIKGA